MGEQSSDKDRLQRVNIYTWLFVPSTSGSVHLTEQRRGKKTTNDICLFISFAHNQQHKNSCFVLFNLFLGCFINRNALSYCCLNAFCSVATLKQLLSRSGQTAVCCECTDPHCCFQQGILWKRSGSSLNKEWKKKFVTLSNNGALSYHSSSSVRETSPHTNATPGQCPLWTTYV